VTVRICQLIATCFGIGYIPKGGGTVAAIFCCLIWYGCLAGRQPGYGPVVVTALILLAGVWSAGKVEPLWGEDSAKVVIDEVGGMCLTLLFIPVRWQYVLCGLLLFRFFDIVKPLYIRQMESLKGGLGVMMDDILAGIYSNFILQLIVLTTRL